MSRFKIYIQPFASDGTYSGLEYDVTNDVDISSIGTLNESIDQDEYEVGIFKFNQFRLVMNNQTGKYSDVGAPNSIFQFKRSDSSVKITWQVEDDITQCGTAVCGSSRISREVDLFFGFINDEGTALSADTQKLSFQVLGMESIFEKTEVNYASITNGDTVEEVLYTILNQTPITTVLDVIDTNISVDTNVAIDDKSDLENKTVKEALDDLLFIGNAVLYIKDLIVYITPRTAAATSSKTFYGQGSPDGNEEILELSNFKNGLNKMYNFWTWADATNVESDSTSVDKYGVKKNEIDSSLITNSTKIDTILANLRDEFKDLKEEFYIEVPVSYDNLELFILDKVVIDYPTVFTPADGNPMPIYGVAIYGTARYPNGKWTLTISDTDEWKILARKINTKKQTITFKLKLI